jgi:hypothetical protein
MDYTITFLPQYPRPWTISFVFIKASRDSLLISSNATTLGNLFQNEPVVP